ncbi:metallophosphoesterase [Pseudonocardia sp. GCM10023141]|uniref:metallophosphoesterase n=1 Tax=Pseudonocardia sp. GCM10023141 TaxID=3252653 RepID=UPI00360A160B
MIVNPPGETPDVGVPARLAATMTIGEQQDWLRGYLDRHRVSRRTALQGGASVLAALGLTAAPWARASAAQAATSEVAVIGRHLCFGDDPTSQMAIAGELTAKPTGKVFVDIGHNSHYGTTIEAEVRELISMVPQQNGTIRAADQFFVHALADKLDPGRPFHYRFRLEDGTTTADAMFTTAPDRRVPQPFTFTAFGDHGVSTDPTPDGQTGFSDNYYTPTDTRRTLAPADSIVALIAEQRPAFHLLAGDICYADPSGTGQPIKNNAPATAASGFNNFDPTVWTQYFGSIEKSAASTPWLFATGNHDMEALYDDNRAPGGATHGYAGHAARLDLPKTGPSPCPSVYSVVYGNVAILSLDANDLSQEIPTNAGYSGGKQLAWVTERLGELRADPRVDFIVAFFHHCAFATSSSHASDGGVRAALAPLFDKYSVDLVVQGHNHQYERTNPIKGGTSGAQKPDGSTIDPTKDGTTYICCGSAGRPRYAWQPGVGDRYRGGPNPDTGTVVTSYIASTGGVKVPEKVDWSQTRYLDYAFLTVDVVPARPGGTSTMTVRAISDLGGEIDKVTITRAVAGHHDEHARPTAWRQSTSGLSVPAGV